jgi:hypothetical protein
MNRLFQALVAVASAIVVAAVGAPLAGADIIAVSETPGSQAPGDIDIARIDLSTGTLLALPAGIDTADQELHPSVSSNGRYLVFERAPFGSSTRRTILADLTTGQMSDLFNGFQASAIHPSSPSITPDGEFVLTGQDFVPVTNADAADVTFTSTASFPTGPYTQSLYLGPDLGGHASGTTADPLATGSSSGSLFTYRMTPSGEPSMLVLGRLGSTSQSLEGATNERLAHPAIASPGGTPIVAFDETPVGTPAVGQPTSADIAFTPGTISGFSAAPVLLPSTVDTPANETRPAFTPDGRYLGFIRTGSDHHERVFVWDSATQTIVNPAGFDLGLISAPDTGNLSLYTTPVFTFASISSSGVIAFRLLAPSGVGILVQRVVGHHELFGRRVPTLEPVGRVPLGHFARGRGHVHWDLRVGGRRLHPGLYQVTVRAVTPDLHVRDLGVPRIVRVLHKTRTAASRGPGAHDARAPAATARLQP